MTLLEASARCPFCWEVITLLIDPSCDHQCYIEDCHVCCRPIELTVTTESGRLCGLQAERAD
ncbi:MAG: CPXCG motif-containing cysteine-rich protein [Gammaproteobacteria bacterium]|jgi:hypothetical protein